MASFTHVAQDISPQYGRVTKITIRVCVTDCTGTVYITDMLLQGCLLYTSPSPSMKSCRRSSNCGD